MNTLTKKKSKKPTIEARTAEANKIATDALSIFDKAARDLELAAELKGEIADELVVQADEFYAKAGEAESAANVIDTAAEADRAAAAKVRGLFG